MKAEIVWLFAGIQRAAVRVAHGQAEGLGVWFQVFWLAVIFGTVAVYIMRPVRAR
ncbi:MAG: hypothetical protein KKA32_16065 [Actinobacteria bacterium]|nr:hypothetical protein [Actinomycetota bacterium]